MSVIVVKDLPPLAMTPHLGWDPVSRQGSPCHMMVSCDHRMDGWGHLVTLKVDCETVFSVDFKTPEDLLQIIFQLS